MPCTNITGNLHSIVRGFKEEPRRMLDNGDWLRHHRNKLRFEEADTMGKTKTGKNQPTQLSQ